MRRGTLNRRVGVALLLIPLVGCSKRAEPQAAPGAAPGAGSAGGGAASAQVTAAPVSARVGQPAAASLVVVPIGRWKLNDAFPASLKVRPPAGIDVPRAELRHTPGGTSALPVTAARLEASVPLTARQAGEQRLEATLTFGLCDHDTCIREERLISWTVTAAP